MQIEYESEEDADEIKMVIRVLDEDGEIGPPRPVGRVPPPAPGAPVFLRGVEYEVLRADWYHYPELPELDWVELTLR